MDHASELDAADLASLCDGCAHVCEWLEIEIGNLAEFASAPPGPAWTCRPEDYQKALDGLIAFRHWLREHWIEVANRLEQTR